MNDAPYNKAQEMLDNLRGVFAQVKAWQEKSRLTREILLMSPHNEKFDDFLKLAESMGVANSQFENTVERQLESFAAAKLKPDQERYSPVGGNLRHLFKSMDKVITNAELCSRHGHIDRARDLSHTLPEEINRKVSEFEKSAVKIMEEMKRIVPGAQQWAEKFPAERDWARD